MVVSGVPVKFSKRTIQALLCLAVAPVLASADEVDDQIGLTELRSRPHALKADGSGISIAQVEASGSGAASPDAGNTDFHGIRFSYLGIQHQVSNHATDIGLHIYGESSGIAPDVRNVKLFSEDSFVGLSGLESPTTQVPKRLGVSIINNSWIGASSSDDENRDILRRLDFLAVRDNVLIVNAVDNGFGTPVPTLMASSYNGLAVGIPNGSSVGPVTFDGAPRAKPDLVAPLPNTSEATAVVSGAGALLMSEAKARRMPVNALATKAMLMAGAQHLDGYERGLPGTEDDQAVPLDYMQGAGQLRIDNSFDILVAGRQSPGNGNHPKGWALAKANPRKAQVYTMNFRAAVPEFSAILTWDREIPNGAKYKYSTFAQRTPVLADLDIALQKKSGRQWLPVFRSASEADNVESIFAQDLDAGIYRLVVTGDMKENYALAWYSDINQPVQVLPSPTPVIIQPPGIIHPLSFAVSVPEPSSALAAIGAAAFLLRRRRR